MSSSYWNRQNLGSLAQITKLAGFEYTNHLSGNFQDVGVPVIQGRNIKNKKLNLDSMKYISKELSNSLSRSKVNYKDILFSYVGTVGDVYFHDSTQEIHLGSNVAKISCVVNGPVIPEYIFYVLQMKDTIEQVRSRTKGSVQSNINMKDLRSILISYPSISEQKEIIKVLTSIDNKIEINNKINKTLEEMAQAIFKSWFVDFEPFKDEEFIESECGFIPKGWFCTSIEEIGKFVKGKKPKDFIDKNDTSMVYLTIDVFENGKPLFSETDKLVIAKELDILFVMDGGSSGAIYYGRKGIVGSTFGKLMVEDDNQKEYLFWFLKHLEPEIRKHNTGSAIPHLDKGYVLKQKFILPDNNVLQRFSSLSYNIRSKIISRNEENRLLVELRDSLLPKLMSGEIRVPFEEGSNA